MTIFEKWNKEIDGEALAKDKKEIEANGTDYPEIPHGEYEVAIEKMEIKECKSEKNKGLPMFSAQFKIVEGEYKGNYIFMNNLIVKPYPLKIVCDFLNSLDSGVEVDFNGNYADFNDTILDVLEKIDGVHEYCLSYQTNNKGYNVFEIVEVYDI